MKKNIFLIFLLLAILMILLIDRRAFQTEILRLNHAIISLERSNTDLGNIIVEQNQKLGMLHKYFAKNAKHASNISLAYWLMLAIALLNIILFFILKNKLSSAKNILTRQMNNVKGTLGMEVSYFAKMLEKQCHARVPAASAPSDHTLPISVGVEVHRMRKRIGHIPENMNSIRALNHALKRLEASLNKSGYEIVDLLGKPFSDGLAVHARFVPSDDLDPGEQIITKVILPQINFDGVLIQAGEVEVSIGE